MWSIIDSLARLVRARHAAPPNWPTEQRAALLQNACTAMRLGYFDEAYALLSADLHAARDASCLNLLGVIHELRQQWKLARKHYRKAIRADHDYLPARQNLRRLYELDTFGRSAAEVALGDERPALALLLQSREPADNCIRIVEEPRRAERRRVESARHG